MYLLGCRQRLQLVGGGGQGVVQRVERGGHLTWGGIQVVREDLGQGRDVYSGWGKGAG
jgi:hypothetical protein